MPKAFLLSVLYTIDSYVEGILPIDNLVVASLTQPLCSLPEAVVSPLLLRLILEGCSGCSAMEYIQMINWEMGDIKIILMSKSNLKSARSVLGIYEHSIIMSSIRVFRYLGRTNVVLLSSHLGIHQ